jgi:putative tricarboxylic transport membrane protein
MSRTDLRSFPILAGCLGLGAALALPLSGTAQAQDEFPSGPIEIINMSSPGGGTDIFLRTLAICAQEELGTDIVVLSKTGGLGAAMVNYAANRDRDGHTLMALNPGAYVTVSKGKTPVQMDELVALARGTEDPQFFIAKAGSPLTDAKVFLEEARKRPIKMGGTHVGGTDWVAGMLLAKRGEFQPPIYVPFGGGGEIVTNVIGGNLEVGILNYSEAEAQIQSGDVVPVLVMSDQPFAKSPDTPTTVDLGIDATMATLRGVGALKGVPEDRLAKLESAFLKAMECEEYQNYLATNGLSPDSIADGETYGKQMEAHAAAFLELESEMMQSQ